MSGARSSYLSLFDATTTPFGAVRLADFRVAISDRPSGVSLITCVRNVAVSVRKAEIEMQGRAEHFPHGCVH